MKIAVTADLHLTTKDDHPERYEVLENILRQCSELGIDLLVIAGDLFDDTLQNFADFEDVYRRARPDDLQTVVLPGNHDPDLRGEAIAEEALAVIDDVHPLPVGNHIPLLLVPYRADTTMGEAIAPHADELSEDRWILVGHGDWASGLRVPNPYEPGVYMPLTRQDVETYRPARVFLGHIHRPYEDDLVYYPGSPCPLNINETGLRRLLIFDTQTRDLRSELVDSPQIYFNETFVILPVEDEAAYLEREIEERVEAWGLPEGWESRVTLRAKLTGYTTDKPQIRDVATEALSDFELYDEEGVDVSELSHTGDLDRDHITRQVQKWIDALDWKEGAAEPGKDEILTQAMKVIYGT
ncbi:MAG: metallophosphoesterase [Anaerolineales bacterium]|nr:metallophosphoesterase [Anaerolineales bacterium]